MFVRAPEEEALYKLLQANPKGHSRMILDAAWAPCESPVFATAGRDKQVRIWASARKEDGELQFAQAAALPCGTSVTAIDFLPRLVNGKAVLAVGTEAGRLAVYLVSEDGSAAVELPLPDECVTPLYENVKSLLTVKQVHASQGGAPAGVAAGPRGDGRAHPRRGGRGQLAAPAGL